MTTSNIREKQKDRVAYWSGSGVSGGGPSILANQSKKSYRARGCRGGASRKNRKKHASHHENEENDPHRLNISEAQGYNAHVLDDGSQDQKVVDDSNKRTAELKSDGSTSDESRSNYQGHPHRKMRTLPILPDSNGFSVRRGVKEHTTLKIFSEAEPLNQSHNRANTCPDTAMSLAHIHFNSIPRITPRSTTKLGIHAIARPAIAPSDSQRQTGVGFSFFSISPSSFLTGRRTAKDSDYRSAR